jgi:hypothetical protein
MGRGKTRRRRDLLLHPAGRLREKIRIKVKAEGEAATGPQAIGTGR